MTAEEAKALPIAQKIQIMEALWEDLRDRFDQLDLPQSHRDFLDERRARVKEGSARLLDWDTVKSTIGR
jgi:putative addiction module component (TIGR02574 family)